LRACMERLKPNRKVRLKPAEKRPFKLSIHALSDDQLFTRFTRSSR
jgi:hypothetical protein